jgi:ADP-ribose pyrophosphatase YjhB (NUDIX family)
MPHIHDKVDSTVEVFLVYGDKVLLRKHDKYKIWLSVGGHIELDEDPNQAAVREVKEEVGIDIELFGRVFASREENFKELVALRFMNRHRISEAHEHVTLVYFAKSPTDKIKQGSAEISEEARWFTAQDIDDPGYGLKDNIRRYAKRALEELGSR